MTSEIENLVTKMGNVATAVLPVVVVGGVAFGVHKKLSDKFIKERPLIKTENKPLAKSNKQIMKKVLGKSSIGKGGGFFK